MVDVKNIAELRALAVEDGRYRLGAAVTGMEAMEHEGFNEAWPGVVDGVKLIGSIQVRGRATVGGNLCNASPAADSVPALIAAGAVAAIAGPAGAARRRSRMSRRGRASPRSPRARSWPPSCSPRGRRARATAICASRRAPRWTSPWWASGST